MRSIFRNGNVAPRPDGRLDRPGGLAEARGTYLGWDLYRRG